MMAAHRVSRPGAESLPGDRLAWVNRADAVSSVALDARVRAMCRLGSAVILLGLVLAYALAA